MPAAMRRAPRRPRHRARHRARAAGFTLLEAVVALALVAATVVPLYGFFSRSIDGLFRAADANRESEASLTAIAYLEGLNPMDRPTGEEPLGPYRLRWTSRELVPRADGIGYPRGLGAHQVALYEVTGEILRGAPGRERVWVTLPLRLVGFRRVRDQLPFTAPASSG
jgi:general secretion pathway protein I